MPGVNKDDGAAHLEQVPGQYDGESKATINKLPPVPKGRVPLSDLENEP